MFKLIKDSEKLNGTHLVGEIVNFTYQDMERTFGVPLEGDGYKVSGEWIFEGDNSEVFTIYDYQETHLYDSDLPTVSKWRLDPNPKNFHIGGRTNPEKFIQWLVETIKHGGNKKVKTLKKYVGEINSLLTEVINNDVLEDRVKGFDMIQNIKRDLNELGKCGKKAPEWVGALVHARNAIAKRDGDSTALHHIDDVLVKYHEGELS